MKLVKQVSAVVCIASLLTCSGCSASISQSFSASRNLATDQTTLQETTTVTIQLGGGAKPNFVTDGNVTTYGLVQSIPSEFTPNTSSPAQVTLTATTDTGYVSSITLTLQPTSTTVGPVNQGDVVYAYAAPSSTALTTWEQNVGANTTAQAQISAASTMPLTDTDNPGTYQLTSIVQTPAGSATSSTSIGIGLSGIPGPPTGCPSNPSCIVRDEPPLGN
jgi:hypothetical protein